MNYSNYRITLDVRDRVASVQITAKKGDTGRSVHITLTDRGTPFEIQENAYAVFAGVKPDGTMLYNKTTIENNTIIYELTQQTTAVPGVVNCEVKLFDSMSNLLTSPKLTILVDDVLVPDEEIESQSETSALAALIIDSNTATRLANEAANSANSAAEQARSAAESANNAANDANQAAGRAETATATAESAATNANTAASEANRATGLANEAATNANKAKDNANIAANHAETEATNANQAAEAANNATTLANKSASSASQAAESANSAASKANTEAGKASQATIAASNAAESANKAATSANEAATTANAATEEIVRKSESFQTEASAALQTIRDIVVDNESAPALVCEETGNIIALNDSSNRLVQGLSIYGKTTQDGTPTPEAPVELVSAGASGSIGVNVGTSNMLVPRTYGTVIQDSGVSYTEDTASGTLQVTSNGGAGVFRQCQWYWADTSLIGKTVTVSVDSIVPSNSNLTPKVFVFAVTSLSTTIGFKYSGQLNPTTNSITFVVPEGVVGFSVIARIDQNQNTATGDTLTVKGLRMNTGETALPYEPYIGQTLTASTPNGLHGIGEVKDEIDFARGVRVQRFKEVIFNGSENWSGDGTQFTNYLAFNLAASDKLYGFIVGKCNILKTLTAGNFSKDDVGLDGLGGQFNYITIKITRQWLNNATGTNAEEVGAFKTMLADMYNAGTPCKVVYQLAEPIETALTAEELAAYAALHTNKPNTTLYNDAGTDLEVTYVADTKLYIDNKFTQLQNAILSAGANI